MLRSLKEVQSDDSVVGFYQATSLGSFFNQSLVETQAIHQNKLRHGGIVVVHGRWRNYNSSCLYASFPQTLRKLRGAILHSVHSD